MSRGAVENRGRRREIRERPLPIELADLLEPGSRYFTMGRCTIILSQQRVGWHMTISKPDKLPTWEEIREARYALIPDEAVMAMLLPPRSEYVNLHDFCMQLYEIPASYITHEQDRL